jgi:hypothetical protein
MAYARFLTTLLVAAVFPALSGGAALAADAAPAVDLLAVSPSETPYPLVARIMNLPGRATLACTADSAGDLHDCKAASEEPANWGFADAALRMAPGINVGVGSGDRPVQVPIGFRLDPDEIGADARLKTPGFYIPDDQITWAERPQAIDFITTYPSDAAKKDVAGFVALACRVAADGRLNPCLVMTEEPKGEGFDKAAQQLIAKFRLSGRLKDGRPVANGIVRQGLSWSLH